MKSVKCDMSISTTSMRVRVLLHVGLLVEGLATERAVERAYVGVDEQVRAES